MLVSPWNTNYPATWSHRLRQFKKTGPLWAERRPPSPLTGTGSTRQGPHTACSIKKRAPASLEPVCFFMVGMARFERAASASRTLRSSQTEPHPVAREDITPKACRMQAFFSKKIFLRSCQVVSVPARRSPGHGGTCFAHIGQLGFDFMKKGAKMHIPVRLPGKNF